MRSNVRSIFPDVAIDLDWPSFCSRSEKHQSDQQGATNPNHLNSFRLAGRCLDR